MAAEKSELRGLAPTDLVAALDAIAVSHDIDRTALINAVLGAYVKKVAHRSIVLQRMSRGNALLTDASAPTQELDL